MSTPAMSAAAGAALLVWVGGTRILDPREVGWVMHGDWIYHFLGWQFFRHEPWQWPPGAIRTFLEPIGTSLGYTDSIPLVAFALKPFARWLPDPMQFLGLWFLLCFSLQGLFGALVMSTWTDRRALQVIGAGLFLLVPALLARIAHPALCAHWLILWALWLHWRIDERHDRLQHMALAAASGLVHPYLAVMVLALLLALLGRRLIERQRSDWSAPLMTFALSVAALVSGWWASGLFLMAPEDLADLAGSYSMNLLAIVNPGTRSFFLEGFPVVSLSQFGEGYNYLGAGVLLLAILAAPIALVRRPWTGGTLPLLLILIGSTLYAVLPQVAIGRRVLIEVPADLALFDVFRSTGRFFWPVSYALVAAAAGVIARELHVRLAAPILALVLALQVVDLHAWWLEVHHGSRGREFYEWDMPLGSREWGELLQRYRHVRLYFPAFCRGPVAAPTAAVSYLAGVHGLSLNDGSAARLPVSRFAAACRAFGDDFTRGFLDESTVYLLTPALTSELEARLGAAVSCRAIDGVGVCVSSRSVERRGRRP